MKVAHLALWTSERRYVNADVGRRYQRTRRPEFVSCIVTCRANCLPSNLAQNLG